MSALDEAACVLRTSHPDMWACSSCSWRSPAARAVEERDTLREVRALRDRWRAGADMPPLTPAAQVIDVLVQQLDEALGEGHPDPAARPATPDPDRD